MGMRGWAWRRVDASSRDLSRPGGAGTDVVPTLAKQLDFQRFYPASWSLSATLSDSHHNGWSDPFFMNFLEKAPKIIKRWSIDTIIY